MAGLPVLTFHAIHTRRTPVAIDAATFRAMIARLKSAGWRTVPAAEAVLVARGDKAAAPRTLVITFDDGYASTLLHAAPALREAGFGAIVFVGSDLVGRDPILPDDRLAAPEPALTWEQIRSLAAQGFEIGSHAASHRDLRRLADADLDREIATSQRVLEQNADAPVRLFAYPLGHCDDRVATACARVYDGAFTTTLARVRKGCDPWRLPRLDAHYLRSLATRGDLDAPGTRAYLAVRRAGRVVRAAMDGEPLA